MPSAKGKATTDQKVTSALRQLCYGATADSLVECLRLSESLNALCLKQFCNAIILALKSEYLRLPNCDELKAIEAQYSAMVFSGCIGCVDVASWYWNKCPVGRQGQYRGKEGKSCCRLEVVCDDSLYIWFLKFGTPGSRNDISVMHHFPLFNAIRTGSWPPARPPVKVGSLDLTWFY
jgi:Plant transposon protein